MEWECMERREPRPWELRRHSGRQSAGGSMGTPRRSCRPSIADHGALTSCWNDRPAGPAQRGAQTE